MLYMGCSVWQGFIEGGGATRDFPSPAKVPYGSREGQFPRWRSAVRVRSEGSALEIRSESWRFRREGSAAKAPQ